MEKFEKKLTDKIMNSFSLAKEWSDLMAILKELKTLMNKHSKELNMAKITDKIALTKRLAQCLNNTLPAGLHEVAMEVYDQILTNILEKNNNYLGEDLGLYASGLFPFFQNANSQNKSYFLEKIIYNNFISLHKTELELCLPGLLVSILPGLEDQNEQNCRTIKEHFMSFNSTVGTSMFFGCLWSIILRTQRLRFAGMKYITEIIPTYAAYLEKNDEERKMMIDNYYPKMETMIINSLYTVIKEDDLQTQRMGMDFVITRFPINNIILSDDNKVTLLIACLSLLEKNEYSTTRRLSKFLVGTDIFDDDLDTKDNDIQYMIKLLILAFKRIFNSQDATKEQLISNLKIIERLLNQQVALIEHILENVSFELIKCIENYWETDLKSNENCENDEIIKRASQFLQRDDTFIESLWKSLGNHFTSCVENNASQKEINETIKLLKFSLLFIGIKKSQSKSKVKYYIPIISSLLKAISNVQIHSKEKINNIRPTLLISLVFMKSFQEQSEEKAKTQKIMMRALTTVFESVISDQATLTSIINKISDNKDEALLSVMKSQEYQTIFDAFTNNMAQFQQCYLDLLDQLMLISEKQMNRNEVKTFIISSELIIRLKLYDQNDDVPTWVYSLEKIAFGNNIHLALEALYFIINLLMINIENPSYRRIQEHLKYDELNDNVISQDLLTILINQTHIRPNCFELVIARLLYLVEDQEYQKKVIDLLVNISRADLDTFINTLSNTFAINEFIANEIAIKKFSQFWKLLNEYYPSVIYFKNGECIFKMLDFLDHEHPLLRHLSKSWLNQSILQFKKILDPLLFVLLSKDTSWKLDSDNHLYFDKECDNRRIIDVFRKLKNIIINTPKQAIDYLIMTECTRELIDNDDIGKQIEENTHQKSSSRKYYLGLLVSISLRFIQGQLLQELTKTISKENFSVNAAACEFLEFLLSVLKNDATLMNIALDITIPVYEVLARAINDKDEVMQVQLLNLLKVLLIETSKEHNKRKTEILPLFTHKLFIDCLLQGIQMNYFFVRSHFIHFVEGCLSIFSNILEPKSQKEISTQLITTTYQFLSSRVNFKLDMVSEYDYSIFGKSIEEKNKFIYKNYLEEYKDIKRFDENDINIIVKGLKEILFHFLPKISKEPLDLNEIKKRLTTKQTNAFSDYLKNLFSTNNFEEQDGKDSGNSNSNEEIFKYVGFLLVSFTSVWVNTSDSFTPRDYCLTDKGILAYHKNDDASSNHYNEDNQNKKLKDLITEITVTLFKTNPLLFFIHVLQLWKNKNKALFKDDKTDKLYQLTLIEILNSMNIPLEIIFSCLNNYFIRGFGDKVKTFTKSKNKIFLISYDQSVEEAQICHFLYSYILLSKDQNKENLSEIWEEAVDLFYIFIESKNAYTICWIYEVLNLMLHKYPLRSLNDNTIKKNISEILSRIIRKLMDISFYEKFEAIIEESQSFITPITPTMYENTINAKFPRDNVSQKINNEAISMNKDKAFSLIQSTNTEIIGEELDRNNEINLAFYNEYYMFIITDSKKSGSELQSLYRKISLITLKSLFYSSIKNCYGDKGNEMKYTFDKMLKSLIILITQEKTDTKNNTQFYKDIGTEIIHSFIIEAGPYTCSIGKQILMDHFLNEEFFMTTPKRIRLWKSILEHLADNNNNIIGDLINQMDSGFFLSKSNSTKIKVLRRISFVIYSCKKDTFSSKLNVLKEKVKELITQCANDITLEAEIFLMIRVLFLRFSHDNVMDMIRALWPMIFSEFVIIMTKKKSVKPSIELLCETYKLIELLSYANIDEFSLYQWIFIIDTFETKRLDSKDNDSLMHALLSEKRNFKPITMNICDKWENCAQDLVTKIKKNLIISNKVKDDEALVYFVKKFFYSIGDTNNFKVKVNYEQIEQIIEKDFLLGLE